jgi:streptomycin 6-kinase
MPIRIPATVAASCCKSTRRMTWLERLPVAITTLEQKWSLELAPAFDGPDVSCSLVAPVRQRDGTHAILKIGMPHFEGHHEMDGLRFWSGDPTVRLLASDTDRNAMLLERCEPGTPLRELALRQQDKILAALLHRLWRVPPAPHSLRPLSALTEFWSEHTLAQKSCWPDEGLVREGLRLFHDLPRNASTEVLLATDLHAGNVLRAQREPWLVIDPKPFVGDPAYDATQHLFNDFELLCSNPVERIRRFADILELDYDRIRLWTFARVAAEPRDNWHNPAATQLAHSLSPL